MPTIIFDCDGVLADTEPYGHLPAFNQTFTEMGLPVQWSTEEYGELLAIGGGKERMATLLTPAFVQAAGLPADSDAQRELLASWHRRKTAIYAELIRSGGIPARPGVARLMREALAEGWGLAVASTSAEASVRAVLERVAEPTVAEHVTVFAGDVVPKKKPAPDIYLLAVSELGVAGDAIVIEDSDIGVRAATGAGLPCVVTTSHYTAAQDFTGASLVVSSLGEPTVASGSDSASASERTAVIRDPLGLGVDGWVSIDDLARCLESASRSSAAHEASWPANATSAANEPPTASAGATDGVEAATPAAGGSP